MSINPQLKNPNFYFMIATDAVLFVVSLCLAYLMRFEFIWSHVDLDQLSDLLLWMVPLKSILFLSLGLYRGMWRFTSVRDFWLLARACFLSTALIMMIILATTRFHGFSRGIFVADCVITFFLTGGLRISIRSLFAFWSASRAEMNPVVSLRSMRVLIVGAGQAGEKILREIMDNNALRYAVVGFIDDDPNKIGRSIHGVKVLGSVNHLPAFVERFDIQMILIAIPSASGEQVRRIVEICQKTSASYKILPGIGELIDGRVSVKSIRDISYEDLLGRKPIHLDTKGIRQYLDGKTVLITGCGGSIGSELCRQVVRYQPRRLVLLDASEANVFNIEMELQNEKFCRNVDVVLGHVQDEILMDNVFEKFKPEVVFHAAAYKHVPMLEKNPWQAVFNNIVGSRVIMEMAVKHHVDRFVLVSTDKAVRPSSVMGASKRVTELIMQCQQDNGTRLMAVRFGNVVGSSGSVIPLFRRQIERGGPVTVTHPEVNRFFMTIPEAAQMILQAGAMGEGGEVYILRMGTPVRIDDMARDLIRLSGKEPDVDIKIVYTGLREGEKLYEELITVGEDILPTSHEHVMVLRSNHLFNGSSHVMEARRQLYDEIDELVKIASRHDASGIKKKLKKIVPEYTMQENVSIL